MRPRRIHRWTAWLLPLLIARLFVPAGFMLTMVDGRLDVIVCSGNAAMPAPNIGAAHQHHEHHAGMDHSAHAMHGHAHGQQAEQGPERQGHENTICPFAVAGAGAGWQGAKALEQLPRLADEAPDSLAAPAWNSPAVLIDRIRGPPLV